MAILSLNVYVLVHDIKFIQFQASKFLFVFLFPTDKI